MWVAGLAGYVDCSPEHKQPFFSLEIVLETCENHCRLYLANIIFILSLGVCDDVSREEVEVEVVCRPVKMFYINKNIVGSLRVECGELST